MTDPLVFVAFQSSSQANGGLESLTQLIRAVQPPRIVITQRETAFTQAWRDLGCKVFVLDVPGALPLTGGALFRYRARRLPDLGRVNRDVFRIVSDAGAPVVHCNDIAALTYAGVGARLAGSAIVFNVRDTLPPDARYGIRWRTLRHLASEIVVLSRDMKDRLELELRPLIPFGRTAPTSFIYSAVDLARMFKVEDAARGEIRRALDMAAGLGIGYVGTFNPKKNQLRFIEEAAPRILSRVPGATLYFLGDADPDQKAYEAACRGAVAANGLDDRVRFVGFSRNLADWYRALDIVCLASCNEGLARAMIESLACGTPVVSFDVSSAREILVENECGLVVPQGDYETFSAAVHRLGCDELLRREFGRQGARIARELFDPSRSVAFYEGLYRRLGRS